MKKILFFLLIPTMGFSQINELLKQVENQLNIKISDVITPVPLSQEEIGKGLKEALQNGIEKQVTLLTKTDGFYKNELVKIMLPDEIKKIDQKLRQIGLNKLADQGLIMINRAAEDAVKTATPVFVDAVKNMTFNDAKNILLGNETSATNYLENTTSTALYTKFSPVIKNSFAKVGADKVWKSIITKYNTIPLTEKVNPNLTDYTTQKAMLGVFKMIAIEEKNIRTNINARTTNLLKKVFAYQDKK